MTQQQQQHFLSSVIAGTKRLALLAANTGTGSTSSNSLSYHWRYAVIDCFDDDCNQLGLLFLYLMHTTIAAYYLICYAFFFSFFEREQIVLDQPWMHSWPRSWWFCLWYRWLLWCTNGSIAPGSSFWPCLYSFSRFFCYLSTCSCTTCTGPFSWPSSRWLPSFSSCFSSPSTTVGSHRILTNSKRLLSLHNISRCYFSTITLHVFFFFFPNRWVFPLFGTLIVCMLVLFIDEVLTASGVLKEADICLGLFSSSTNSCWIRRVTHISVCGCCCL